jgi:hypothetical protein
MTHIGLGDDLGQWPPCWRDRIGIDDLSSKDGFYTTESLGVVDFLMALMQDILP